jgi:hypothetical protein
MELEDNAKFCFRCGANMAEVMTNGATQPTQTGAVYTSSTGATGFVGSTEGGSFSLKNGRFMNILSGEGFVKEDAIITDRRLYYSARSGLVNINSREEVVDIADITGTKITDFKPYSLFIYAGLVFLIALILNGITHEGWMTMIGLLLAGILVATFFIAKKSHLRIEYAGGNINFSVKKYGLQNVRAFQRQIYIAKEKLNKQKD